MNEDNDFLGAIAASPRDVVLRRAYADWLEERGDARHEIVRVCQAMRELPVWSDHYWDLKARRNELWGSCPVEWLEATGYDGSFYDPVFRDGVPDDWRGRWRLVREFIERWRGIDVPDVGGRQQEIQEAEKRLELRLPASVREYVALAHQLEWAGSPVPHRQHSVQLFHCASYRLDHLASHPGLGLVDFSLDNSVMGLQNGDLGSPDPPTYFFHDGDVDFDDGGTPFSVPRAPFFFDPTLSLTVFRCLFNELPTAGSMATTPANPNAFLSRLARDFPVRASFDDADIFEGDDLLVLVKGARGSPEERRAHVILRRPVPIATIPVYLFGTNEGGTISSGLLGSPWFRRQEEEAYSRPGTHLPLRWVSVPRRNAPKPDAEHTRPALLSPQSDKDIPL